MEVNIKHDELAAAKQLVPDSTDGNCFIPNKIDCIACRVFLFVFCEVAQTVLHEFVTNVGHISRMAADP